MHLIKPWHRPDCRSFLSVTPLAAAVGCLFSAGMVGAQTSAASPAAPTETPAASQRVEINGARQSDVEQRRRSTAAKIVVGREEIEQFGDATVGDILKRLPGVSLQGTPGRGGQIRMRGLGNGYTQILLDGERVQGGLSLDSINPDQIERIEIIRAPTAETGARAIGGTINIVTREGFTRRLNDLKVTAGWEHGHLQPGASWSRDDRFGSMDYNLSVSGQTSDREDASRVHTEAPGIDRTRDLASREWRQSLHLTSRLQWRGDAGSSLMLMPLWVQSDATGRNASTYQPALQGTLPYLSSQGESRSHFALGRLNGQWRTGLGEGRLELRGGLGEARSNSHNQRTERAVEALGGLDGWHDDHTSAQEHTLSLNGKYTRLLEGDHSLVAGAELDQGRREESRDQRLNGQLINPDADADLQARSLRSALYAQDEWSLSPNWAAHAGLRWEGIVTRGTLSDGAAAENRSSVWSPLMHAVWKPDPKGQDQLRISLTRSYRAPTLGNLMGGTVLAASNSPTTPDRQGNPDLKPELATGVDVAVERYLPAGGLLSVNLFQRHIQDLMRTLTTAQTQPDGSVRYVAQPRNLGMALTRGVELEAKFRLNAVWETAPALDLRSNLSVFQSRVDGVPGPDNRLDQQPGATANLGADYRLPGWPLTLGGGLNWTPGYTTRLSDTQWVSQAGKRVIDAYLLWQLEPNTRLRLSASNLAPQHYDTSLGVEDTTETTRATTVVSWRLQLEMKL